MDILTRATDAFRGLAALEPRLAIREARLLLDRIGQRPDVADQVRNALTSASGLGRDPEWHTLAQSEDVTLQLFVWPVGARTPIHDHTSWGVYACVQGHLGEDRYIRLDDGAVSGVAHLRRDWRSIWTATEQSALLPYAGGIHRVYNAGAAPAVSLHLYGPRVGALDGRDYDPARDRVCERPPEPEVSPRRRIA